MDRQKLLEHIRRIILEARPGLNPGRVTESASMTNDLDLDSPHLEVLFARLREEVMGSTVRFTPWYIRALRPGQDTVGSLVDFLLEPKGSAWRSSTPVPVLHRPSSARAVALS